MNNMKTIQDSRSSSAALDHFKERLKNITKRPTLSELLLKTIEKKDIEAARQAEVKLEQMNRQSEANLKGRVKSMLGMPE